MSIVGNDFGSPYQQGMWQPPTTQIPEILRQPKPWVRFLSILGFIMSALMVVGGALLGLLGVVSGRADFLLLVIIYPLCGLLYFIPCVFLHRYASRISDFLSSGQPGDLEDALEAQKSFWKFMGVLSLVVLCCYAVIFAIAIVVAALR